MRKIILTLFVFVPAILLSGCYTTYPNNYSYAGYSPGYVGLYGGGWGGSFNHGYVRNGWYGHGGGWARGGWGNRGWGHAGWGHRRFR